MLYIPFILQIPCLADQKTLVEIKCNKMTDHMNCEHTTHSKVKVQKCLVAKDDSDVAYHELHMVSGVNLPPLNLIAEERKKQNNSIEIKPFENYDSDLFIYLLIAEKRNLPMYTGVILWFIFYSYF